MKTLAFITEDQKIRRYFVRLRAALMGRDVIWGDPWAGAFCGGTMMIYGIPSKLGDDNELEDDGQAVQKDA